jgi:hypothetical protein
MCPRVTLVSDSRCPGVSPDCEHSRAGVANRVMSPISATSTAASTGPMPGSARMAWYPSWRASRSAMAASSPVISAASSPASARSEATFPAYGWPSSRPSSQVFPHTPKMSLQVTAMPSLAKTAWTWSLQLVRSRTSLIRYLVSSRSSRISAGAIHASGSRPIRSKPARSAASFSSFFTRRQANPFTPSGWARCTCAPAAASVSAAQYPYAASSTTLGRLPARAITRRSSAGLLAIRAVSSLRPSAVIRTSTLRRRCRSIPTTCWPS